MKKSRIYLGALALASASSGMAAPAYQQAGAIAGPDGGGWDYARVDEASHRLYVARASSVTVVDLATQNVTGSLGSIKHGHAVVPIAGNRLLVTSGDDASVRFIDGQDGHELARIAVGKKPDAAIVSDDGKRAYVMNADSGTVSVIDIPGMKILRTITIKPGLEYAALTPAGNLFINDEDANEMEVVDVAGNRAAKAIAMPGCEAPSGLAFDARNDRLIAACANGKAAIVDARTQRLVGLVDIGLGPDAVILDAKRRLAFIPCGKDGVLDILSLDGAQVRRTGRVTTELGARTGALDPQTGTVYLPTARLEAPGKGGSRPTVVPGSFHILVVRPARAAS